MCMQATRAAATLHSLQMVKCMRLLYIVMCSLQACVDLSTISLFNTSDTSLQCLCDASRLRAAQPYMNSAWRDHISRVLLGIVLAYLGMSWFALDQTAQITRVLAKLGSSKKHHQPMHVAAGYDGQLPHQASDAGMHGQALSSNMGGYPASGVQMSPIMYAAAPPLDGDNRPDTASHLDQAYHRYPPVPGAGSSAKHSSMPPV
jgi:hypothetical protein